MEFFIILLGSTTFLEIKSINSTRARISEKWQSAVDNRKWSSLRSEIISVGIEKVQLTLIFNLKQNEEVQRDFEILKHF